jgi:hypothetical protein
LLCNPAGLKFVILLPQPPKGWNYSCVPPHLADRDQTHPLTSSLDYHSFIIGLSYTLSTPPLPFLHWALSRLQSSDQRKQCHLAEREPALIRLMSAEVFYLLVLENPLFPFLSLLLFLFNPITHTHLPWVSFNSSVTAPTPSPSQAIM